MNFIENQNKVKFPLDRNGQVRKDPMYWFQSLSCGSPEAPNYFLLEDYVTAYVNLKWSYNSQKL